jgi:hypothetical protein
MKTTQRKISEQILRRLRGYTDETSIDERELQVATHQSLSSIVRNRYFQGKADETGEVDGTLHFTIHKNNVLKDENTDEYYINTPSSAVSLPFGIDIRRVWSKKGKGYIEVPGGFNDLYAGMEASMLGGNIGFYRLGGNLVFVNMNNANKPNEVSVTMLLPFGNLDEDDEINIPSDMVDEVIEIVFSKFAKTLQIPIDEVNDTKDN